MKQHLCNTNKNRRRERDGQITSTARGFVTRIQVLLVLLVHDDLTTVCPDLLLLVPLARISDKTLPLAVPGNESDTG